MPTQRTLCLDRLLRTLVAQVKIARTVHHKNVIHCYDVLVSRTKVCVLRNRLGFTACA